MPASDVRDTLVAMPVINPPSRTIPKAPAGAANQTTGATVVNGTAGAGTDPIVDTGARSTAAPSGLTGGAPTVVAGGQPMTAPGLVAAPSTSNRLALLPGYPACVGLPDVLKQAAASPQGKKALDNVFAAFEQKTGLAIPDALKASIRAHPERIAEALVVTPQQMHAGFDAVEVAAKAGKLPPTPAKVRQLPRIVHLDKLDLDGIKRPVPELKEIAPGLFQGDVASSLDDTQAKRNIAGAEIFDRLAGNALLPRGEKLTVVYNGKRCASVETFLAALKADGCTVRARVDYRAADFASLKVKNPAAPDGVVDVPAGILVRTGIKDARGNEAVLPAVHGELIFEIRRGPTTKGPAFDTDFKWYQGEPNTGFFPWNVSRRSTWLGKNTAVTFDGDAAVNAARLAGTLGDVINSAAAKLGLWGNGYGATGVCLDSVAVIEQVLTGTATGWPLLMRDQLVLPEIEARLKDHRHNDDADLKALAGAVAAVPSDDGVGAPPAKKRIVSSLPWSKTDTSIPKPPVQCVSDAIDILGA